MEKTIFLENLNCNCNGGIETALNALDGVTKTNVNLKEKTATVTLTKDIDNEILLTTMRNAGYQPTSIN